MNNLLENLVPLFGIVFTFGIPGIIVFWYIHNKHQERMKMIEKGFTPEEARAFFTPYSQAKPARTYGALKWGIILSFLGIGLLLSYVFEEVYDISDSLTPALLLLFAGLGFIVYYLFVPKLKKDNGNIVKSEATK
jgi:cytochrome b subunit of formate dehydrogenase